MDEVERCEFCLTYVEEDDFIECKRCKEIFFCCVDCSFEEGEENLCPTCLGEQ